MGRGFPIGNLVIVQPQRCTASSRQKVRARHWDQFAEAAGHDTDNPCPLCAVERDGNRHVEYAIAKWRTVLLGNAHGPPYGKHMLPRVQFRDA